MLNKILSEEITKSVHSIVDSIAIGKPPTMSTVETTPVGELPVKPSRVQSKIGPGLLSKIVAARTPGSNCATKVNKNTSTKSPTEDQTAVFPDATSQTAADATPDLPGAHSTESTGQMPPTHSAVHVDVTSDKLPLVKRILMKMKWLKSSLKEEYTPIFYDSGDALYELYKTYKTDTGLMVFVENSIGTIYKLNFEKNEPTKTKN